MNDRRVGQSGRGLTAGGGKKLRPWTWQIGSCSSVRRSTTGNRGCQAIISHRTADLGDGPSLYKTFREKKDGCVKVVMFPHAGSTAKTIGKEDRQKEFV
jgi:hypothetical protein